MSKIAIIAIIVGLVAIGSAAAILFSSSDDSVILDDKTTDIAEPVEAKGKDIQLNFEDGISMSLNP